MYVDDLAEFARVFLATNEMQFPIGWLRVQLIFFCQLAGITDSLLTYAAHTGPGTTFTKQFLGMKGLYSITH